MKTASRIIAAGIAAVAWTGLMVQFYLLYAQNSSALHSLWMMGEYFTILTNLLVAVVFSGVALNRGFFRAGWLLAGVMLSILLVGVVYELLLRGALVDAGGSALVDVLLHTATPVLVTLYWIIFARKGTLNWLHPLLWAVYPVAYLAYGVVRGEMTGKYAYPFLDVAAIGWARMALNATAIAAAFLAVAYVLVWIDRRIGSRQS